MIHSSYSLDSEDHSSSETTASQSCLGSKQGPGGENGGHRHKEHLIGKFVGAPHRENVKM